MVWNAPGVVTKRKLGCGYKEETIIRALLVYPNIIFVITSATKNYKFL